MILGFDTFSSNGLAYMDAVRQTRETCVLRFLRITWGYLMTVPAVGMGAVDRTIVSIGWQGETGYSHQRECTS